MRPSSWRPKICVMSKKTSSASRVSDGDDVIIPWPDGVVMIKSTGLILSLTRVQSGSKWFDYTEPSRTSSSKGEQGV